MANNLTKYDANQVLRSVFDVTKNTLRVSVIDGSSGGGGGFEVIITHTDDSIRLGDGTNYFTSTTVGPKVGLDTAIINEVDIRDLVFATDSVNVSGSSVSVSSSTLPTGAATEATLASILTEVQQNLTFINDKVDVSGSSVSVSSLPAGLATEAKQDTGNASLSSIDSKMNTLGQKTMAQSMPVVLSSDQGSIPIDLDAFTATPDSVQTVGSIDGTSTGTKYGFINNLRQQILASHDREQDITYADFGTKDQRITQIDYNSATFGATIARKTISYTLIGNKYRRDSIDWSII